MVGEVNNRSDARTDPHADWDEKPDEIVPISRAEAERLFGADVSRPSRVTPGRVVAAQIVLTLCSMMICAWLFRAQSLVAISAALSALMGGAICWIPSAAFALRLRSKASVGAWVAAEGVKLGITIAMFIAVAVFYRDVRWLPLLVTYVLALKTYWFALAWR